MNRPSHPMIALPGLMACFLVAGCQVKVNDDVIIPAGSTRSGGATTVNGDVLVGRSAIIQSGSLRSVNGSVQIDDDARVGAISTVNGAIRIGAGAATGALETVNGSTDCEESARIDGNIRLVNGPVNLRSGAVVNGDVETVNGRIVLSGATVEGGVGNYNGGMLITNGSLVKGDLVVKASTDGGGDGVPRIVIGRDTKILGQLRFERNVRLFVHDTAQVGRVDGAEAMRFSGDEPDDG